MSTEFGEQLRAAITKSESDSNNFVWKGQKIKDASGSFTQEEFRLVDASEAKLKECYTHCKTMLFNVDKKHPGRVNLLKDVYDQKNRCGVELFFRDAEAKKTTRFAIVDALRTTIQQGRLSQMEIDNLMLGDILTTNTDYQNLPVKLIIDGGLDKLGRFDRSHITLTFILKQGLWFTKQEYKEFAEMLDKSEIKKRELIAEKLGLPKTVPLYFNAYGLSFSQLKAMLSLKNKKYSELTTEQLKALRYKILFALEDEIQFHITQWQTRIAQIEQVAKEKSFAL
jgi:hypothetical protein